MRRMKETLSAYYFISFHFIGFAIFYLIPFSSTIAYSFKAGIFDDSFAGFRNYISILNNIPFRIAIGNNIKFLLGAVPAIMLLSFLLSYALFDLKVSRAVKLMFIVPIFIPSATVIGFYRKLFNEMLDSEYVMIALILIFIWKNIGYNIIIYLASFSSINNDILDSAKIDGANFASTIRHVIFPMSIPTTFFVLIVTIINSFKVFKDIYLLQGSYPNKEIYMIQNFMNNKFKNLQVEQLSAASMLFTALLFGMIFLFIYIERRYLRKAGTE